MPDIDITKKETWTLHAEPDEKVCVHATAKNYHVLAQTYLLLAMNLITSAICAWLAIQLNFQLSLISFFCMLILQIVLICNVNGLARAHSPWAMPALFAFTGLIGFSMGPLLGLVIQEIQYGSQIIGLAFGSTGLIFSCLSAYVITNEQDLHVLGKTLLTTATVALMLALTYIFLPLKTLELAITGLVFLLVSVEIMYDTQKILDSQETNPIVATATLYLDFADLFLRVLDILLRFSSKKTDHSSGNGPHVQLYRRSEATPSGSPSRRLAQR